MAVPLLSEKQAPPNKARSIGGNSMLTVKQQAKLANAPATLDDWKTRVDYVLGGPVDDASKAQLKGLLDEDVTANLTSKSKGETSGKAAIAELLDIGTTPKPGGKPRNDDAFDCAFSELFLKAIDNGDPDFILVFIKSADFKPNHKSGVTQTTALHRAVERHDKDTVTKIIRKHPSVIDEGDKYGQTALHYAAREADRNIIALLLENRANVNAFDSQHISPLHIVSGIEKWPARDSRVDVAKELLSNGAEVNTRDIFGESPLHDAAKSKDSGVMKILLQHGADAECRNFQGQTPRDVLPRSVAPWILELLTRPIKKWNPDNHLSIPTTAPRCWNRVSSDASSSAGSTDTDDGPRDVCRTFFATVHFFYRLYGYSFSRSVSIHDLLHDDNDGGEMKRLEAEFIDLVCERFNKGQSDRPEIQKNIWKWVHLPANQMSWVTDLVWRLTDDGQGLPSSMEEQPIKRKEAWKFLERNVTQKRGVKPGSFTRVPHAGDKFKRSSEGASQGDRMPSKGVKSATSDGIRFYRRESWRNTTTFSGDQKFSLVIPYIDFETEQYLERHESQMLSFREKCELEERSLPYNGLYGLDKPRTLDESYYDMIPEDELRLRDRDQVVFKWFKHIVENDALHNGDEAEKHNYEEEWLETVALPSAVAASSTKLVKDSSTEAAQLKFRPEDEGGVSQEAQETVMASRRARLLMVHQLWLWKLDQDTVITAFPDRYHQGVEDTLVETIRQGGIDSYTKPEQLIENILFECVTFLEEFRYAGLGINILDIFESSIAKRSHQEAMRYTDFRDSLDQEKRALPDQVRGDIRLIHEIKDIRDELHLILRIFETQLGVVKQFADVFWSGNKLVVKKGNAFIEDTGVQRLIDRTRELDDHAKRTLEDLDTLVQMKQAQSSLEEAATAGRLNNYIFLFTLVTIVFTPLSFMTSLFTLPFDSFPENSGGDIRVESNWITRHLVYGEIASLGGILLIGAVMWLYREFFQWLWKKYPPSSEVAASGFTTSHDHRHLFSLAELVKSRTRQKRTYNETVDDRFLV